jgi:hypothetical protein
MLRISVTNENSSHLGKMLSLSSQVVSLHAWHDLQVARGRKTTRGVSSIVCINLSLLHLNLLHSLLGENVHDLNLVNLDLILWELLNNSPSPWNS